MKKIILLITLLFTVLCQAQHNGDYIQYMFNGLLVNPAYAGNQDALNVTTMYRQQWVGLSGAPADIILTGHSPLKNKKLNLGAMLVNDRFGVYNHTNASLVYAYKFKLADGKLALGLQGGIDAYSTNWNKIRTSETGDPSFAPAGTRQIKPLAGAGAYYQSKRFFLGLSAPNLLNNQLSTNIMTILTAGMLLKVNETFRIKPALLVKRIGGSPMVVNLSTTFYYKEIIGLGLGYTYNNSLLAYADIKINDQLNFGYGYAYMSNALSAYTSGSHEIMLRYLFRYRINAINARFF